MKRFVALAALFGAVVLPRSSSADDVHAPLVRLFRQQADIVVAGPDAGWVEVDLPPEILRSCRPDLADVRVLDSARAEVPFALETKGTHEGDGPRQESYPARITGVERHTSPTLPILPGPGPAGSDAKATVHETYQLLVPEEARHGTKGFELVVQSRRADFVRTMTVTALDPPPARALATHASIFRLTGNGALGTRVTLAGPLGARLSIELDGEDTAFLDPTFAIESSRPADGTPALSVGLETVRTVAERGRTEFSVARPAGIVPTAVSFGTTTALFDRRVTIADEGGPAAGAILGAGVVCRGQCLDVRPNVRVPVAKARGDRLRIVIEDGDSPALASVSVDAIIPQPSVRIPSSALRDGHATLLFGSPRVRAPKYDLAGLASPAPDTAPDVRPGRLEHIRANDAFDPSPALGWAMHAGATVDASPYRFARTMDLAPSVDGLSQVVLGPEDTAAARADLADLRIMDASGAQWPYLLERDPYGRWLALSRSEPRAAPKTTRVEFALPARPLAIDGFVLDIRDPYFHRAYHLSGTDADGQEIRLQDGELARDLENEPRAIELAFASTRVGQLVLEIENGDDAPLDLRSAQVRMVQPVLYVAAPAGSYSLVVGNPEGSPPAYDVQRARDTVLAVRSAPATLGAFGPNPSFRRMTRLSASASLQDIGLWAALIAATLVLGGLTLRLARAPSAPRDAPQDDE